MIPINWDTVKYIFQVPLDWYRTIHAKVFHAYGVNFVRVRQDGEDGGLEIGVDEKMLADFIEDVAGTPEPGEGTVLSVDNVGPGSDGNVQLNSVRSVNGEYYPDADGNVVIPTGGTVKSVDGLWATSDGNVPLGAVRSVNGTILPDENGNVTLPSGTVKSVDNVSPDSNGNVSLGAVQTTDVGDAGITAGLDYTGEYTVAPMAHGHSASDIVDVPIVLSVNGEGPDADGNVELGDIIKTVDGVGPDSAGNVDLKAVRSVKAGGNVFAPDGEGQVNLGDIGAGTVKTVNGEGPDASGNVDLGDIVLSVNGEGPDADGNVEIAIPAKMSDLGNDKLYQTNEEVQGAITSALENLRHSDITDWEEATKTFLDVTDVESPGVTAGLDYSGPHPICPTNHGHHLNDIVDFAEEAKDALDGLFVTLDTEQKITAEKNFSEGLRVGAETQVASGVVVTNDGTITSRHQSQPAVKVEVSNGTVGTFTASSAGVRMSTSQGNTEIAAPENGTSRVDISASPNCSVLKNAPTDNCNVANAISTVGWVRKNAGTVKSIDTNYTPDANGNIDLKAVRTQGDQTIYGAKTFNSHVRVINTDGTGQYYPYAINLKRASGGPYIQLFQNNASSPQGMISSSDDSGVQLRAYDGKIIRLWADADRVQLVNQPSANTSTASLLLATIGWCNKYLGKVKSVNGKGPDSNGNVVISTGSGTVKSVDNVSPDSNGNVSLGAVQTTDVETSGTVVNKSGSYSRFVCPTAHGHNSQDVSVGTKSLYDWIEGPFSFAYYSFTALLRGRGFVKSLEINGKSVDFGEDGVDRFEFGLTANKWLKSDAAGRISATDETPIALPAGTTGINATKTIITGLSWNGSQLVATRETWSYTKGVLTGISTASNVTINTVAYS